MFFVYAISSLVKDYIYVGQSDHLIRRFHQHNRGREKTTRPYVPFELISSWEFIDRKSARKVEKYYKTGSGKRLLRQMRRRYSAYPLKPDKTD
jgi:putative endonuclease